MNPNSTKSRYSYLKGVWDVVIMRGYDTNDKTKLITHTCPSCKSQFGYFSKSGKPRSDVRNTRCEDCLEKQITNVSKTHTSELSQ